MRQLYRSIISFLLLVTFVVTSTTGHADSFTSLLMPGKVIQVHEEYEQDCEQCHDTVDKHRQGKLCSQCHAHKNILEDLDNKTGFHGRLSRSEQNNCKHCHTDHEGRDAKIVLLNLSTFNHKQTDFQLKGTHKKTACTACHKKDKKYSEAAAECYSCHKESDVHKGKQGKKCGSCHQATNWKQTAFDHDKTDFPLKNAHKKTSCAACHINQKYKDTPKNCFSCHQINDAHRGSFGKKCESCHSTKQWNKARFDHNKKTDFPLYGKHKKATCNSCHRSGDVKKELPTKCYGCHKNDDSHKGRYGKKCQDCHRSESWQKHKFDHSKASKFKLLGKHKTTACNQCHKGDLYKDELKKTCINCHKNDDVHKGKQGKKCDRCHNEKGWHNNVSFDHDLSNFPLIGMHATTQCEECHLTADYANTETSCNQCHADEDVHKTRLGTYCNDCHNPNSWDTWLFNHDRNTDFKLDGAHKELGCYDCHQTNAKGRLQASKDCISCHRSRDIHNRLFGRQCGDCHSTRSFRDINIKR